jgi:DNA replication protein DnaC
MSAIGVPLRHLENYRKLRHTEAADEVTKWPARGFLVFFGDTGSGKSFGAALAVREYLKSQVTGSFDRKLWENAERAGSAVTWLDAMDIADDRGNATRARRAFLAVIDDLGGECESAQCQSVIRGTILKRYDMKLPTVITTSLTMMDIDARYGSRIADRLTEDIGDGGGIIDCGSVSLRNPAGFLVTGGK